MAQPFTIYVNQATYDRLQELVKEAMDAYPSLTRRFAELLVWGRGFEVAQLPHENNHGQADVNKVQ